MGALDGKIAIVTGAAAGLGRGFTEVLAAAGADVAVCDIQPKVRTVAETVASETGQRVPWWLADVAKPDEVKRFVDGAVDQLGGLDLLVNNAGMWRRTFPLTDLWEESVAQWDRIHGTNLKGTFLMARAAMPHLVARAEAAGEANIVNIGTDHICPPPGKAAGGGRWMDIYDSSKWGLNGLTQSWSRSLAEHGVRVNALCMDATDSEMVRFATGGEWSYERAAEIMHPHQIADLLVELVGEGPDGRTGENIGIWLGYPVELPERREVLPSRHP